MTRSECTAVLVTRGDIDLAPVLASLEGFNEIIVWDNSQTVNLRVFGRYRAALGASNGVVYTQDDDCIVDVDRLLAGYERGKVVCNMPPEKRAEYERIAPGIALVGWGACFDAGLVYRMQPYLDRWGVDELFLRECDRVFTAANDLIVVDVPFRHLPHAFKGRMGNEARHLADLAAIRERLQEANCTLATDH